MEKLFSGLILLVTVIAVAGCDSSAQSGAGASMEELAAGVDAQDAAREQEEARLAAERKVEEERQAAAVAAQQQAAPLEEVTARSGRRGRSLQGGGYLSTVAGTRFWAENQINLNVLRHNMDIYKATHGDYPKTEEEFKKGVLEAYEVRLPELPEGWEYAYDPNDPLTLYMRNTGTGDPSVAE